MENNSVHYRSSKKQDRFLPCLMARLTDNEPQNRIDHVPQMFTVEQLKTNILKNLEMILNSSSRLSADEKDCGAIVRDSVLFLGLPNFSGRPSSKDAIDELRQEIECQHARTRHEDGATGCLAPEAAKACQGQARRVRIFVGHVEARFLAPVGRGAHGRPPSRP